MTAFQSHSLTYAGVGRLPGAQATGLFLFLLQKILHRDGPSTQRKPGSIAQENTYRGVFMKQMEIPILQELKEAELAPWDLVERCRDEHDALMLCYQLRRARYTDKKFCEYTGIDPGHWSRIKAGDAHFPTNKRLLLMRLCGNLAPMQFEIYRAGMRGVFDVWVAARRAA